MAHFDGRRWRNVSDSEIRELATYNAEVHRGLVHTDAWRERMAKLQAGFNADCLDDLNRTATPPKTRHWRRGPA